MLASLIGFGLVGCNSGGGGGGTLATINGETITMEQFYNYLEAKPEVQVVLANGQTTTARVSSTLGFQALQDMIRQRIIVQLAKDNKLAPTPKELDAEVEFQRKRNPNFVTELKERGLTLEQIRESLEVDLSREKLLTSDVKVTMSEVETFIKNNRAQFTTPELLDAKWIFVTNDAKKREVDRELLAGQNFSTVARRLSDDPQAKETLGTFPQRVVAQLPGPIQEVVKRTTEGKDTGWVQLTDGWAKFYVEKKTPEKYNEPTETDKQWLQRQLAVQKGIQSKDLDRRLLDKLKASKIDITYRELKAPWETAYKEIEKLESGNTGTNTSKANEGENNNAAN